MRDAAMAFKTILPAIRADVLYQSCVTAHTVWLDYFFTCQGNSDLIRRSHGIWDNIFDPRISLVAQHFNYVIIRQMAILAVNLGRPVNRVKWAFKHRFHNMARAAKLVSGWNLHSLPTCKTGYDQGQANGKQEHRHFLIQIASPSFLLVLVGTSICTAWVYSKTYAKKVAGNKPGFSTAAEKCLVCAKRPVRGEKHWVN